MIKKILLMAMVVACFSAYAIVGQAEDIVVTVPDGNLAIAFDPSPDERVSMHILYVFAYEEEHVYHLPLGQSTFEFTDEYLWHGESYVMSASAWSDELMQESVRSNTLTIHVSKRTKPSEKPLPGRPGHIPPGQLRK